MDRISLGYRVLFAVLLGIAAGLFFGPATGALKPLGEVYTMLLQMSVLPYICFSLIHGIGSLTAETGRKLLKCGWPYLLALWCLMLLIIFILIQVIPPTTSPIINTTSGNEFESNFSKNFISYLVPQNPLYDISHNIVPAVAIFGLIGGIALMHIAKKEPLLGVLERVNQTIEKILSWLGMLSPIGAFVYISIAFGTIHFEDLYKLEIFVFAFILTTLFVTFWLLPTLIASLTPLSFREATKAFRFVCLLPFVTGLPTTALPFLNIYLKQLSKKHEVHEKFRETSQTVLPIAYSFGNIGNAMILFFIIFLGFYYRHPLSDLDRTLLAILTVPLSIGAYSGNLSSVLFLTQQLGLPSTAADFFLEIKSVTYNFQVMMSIASVLTLIILVLYSYYGLLKIQWKKLIFRLTSPLVLFAVLVFTAKSLIHFEDVYEHLYAQFKVTDVIPHPVEVKILTNPEDGAHREFPNTRLPDVFKQISASKVLKVGFNPEAIPFCYYNDQNQLAGFDICYAYQLAADLGCTIEFIPFDYNQISEHLLKGDFDIGMSAIIMSEKRITEMEFTFPYYENINALIVPRAKRKEYLRLTDVQELSDFKLGAGGAQVQIAATHFPKAQITQNSQYERLIDGTIDAILWSETNSRIWCLSHPEFVTISYGTKLGINYFGYPVRQHATDLGFFLNNWLSLKQQSGFHKAMESYWIDGIRPGTRPPRWSVLRNVLHWVD